MNPSIHTQPIPAPDYSNDKPGSFLLQSQAPHFVCRELLELCMAGQGLSTQPSGSAAPLCAFLTPLLDCCHAGCPFCLFHTNFIQEGLSGCSFHPGPFTKHLVFQPCGDTRMSPMCCLWVHQAGEVPWKGTRAPGAEAECCGWAPRPQIV